MTRKRRYLDDEGYDPTKPYHPIHNHPDGGSLHPISEDYVSYIPIVGTILDVMNAIDNPTAKNIVQAGVSAGLDALGPIVGGAIKGAEPITKTIPGGYRFVKTGVRKKAWKYVPAKTVTYNTPKQIAEKMAYFNLGTAPLEVISNTLFDDNKTKNNNIRKEYKLGGKRRYLDDNPPTSNKTREELIKELEYRHTNKGQKELRKRLDEEQAAKISEFGSIGTPKSNELQYAFRRLNNAKGSELLYFVPGVGEVMFGTDIADKVKSKNYIGAGADLAIYGALSHVAPKILDGVKEGGKEVINRISKRFSKTKPQHSANIIPNNTNNVETTHLPTYNELRDEITNWRQANLTSSYEIRGSHIGHSSYDDVANVENENFYRKLNRSSELASEAMNVQYGNPRTMSDEEYLRGIEEARDLYRRWQTNPESFQVPVRDNITSVRPTQSTRPTSSRPSLSEVEPVNTPSRPSVNTATASTIQTRGFVPNASQPISQRVVHTVDPIPESSPIAKKYTLEELEKIRQESLNAKDVYELAIDDDVLPIEELRKLENDSFLKGRTFKDAAKSYLEDIINNVDVTKPANKAINLNSVPDYLLDELEQGLRSKSRSVGYRDYLDFNYNLGKLIDNRKTLPSGYKTLGITNHPNFISQEGVTRIKKDLKYYTDKASDPRNFGKFTEQFNNNFSLQSKPMITDSLTELSKARKASGSLPVKVQFTRYGRTSGNRMADLIIQDSNGTPIRYGTTSKNGPTEVGTVLKSNIKRELEMYKEFGDQLGIDRNTIDNLSTKFKSGEMSVEDFAKIKTKDGHYMFTTFDKKRKVPRYPSLRFDFKLGGSLNNHRSLKYGGTI